MDPRPLHFAVEVKTHQAKKMGASANLYIVEGEAFCFTYTSRDQPDALKCEITTRDGASKNRIGYLERSNHEAIGCDPRPNHQHQWRRLPTGGWGRV